MNQRQTGNIDRSIVWDVWLPGTQPILDSSALTLKSVTALHFFLEAVGHGHSMFFGQRFVVMASQGKLKYGHIINEPVGTGVYTMQYANREGEAKTDTLDMVELVVHREEGILENFMMQTWREAVQGAVEQKHGVKLDDIL